MREALIWAREGIEPAMDVTSMATALGIPRTTYDSYEKGKARVKAVLLDKVGKIRGLPNDWYAQNQFIITGRSQHGRPSSGPAPMPSVSLPCAGYMTRADFRSKSLKPLCEPISVPANMAAPHYVTAIAESDDTGNAYQEGWVLVFDPLKRGKLGKKVAVRLNDGSTSCRLVDFDGERLVYGGMNGQPALTKDQCTEEGLLVAWIADNRPGKFFGKFDEDGDDL